MAAKTSEEAAAPAASAPIMAKALCDTPGCGMPAIGSANALNHCYNHQGFSTSKDADVVRAKKAAG